MTTEFSAGRPRPGQWVLVKVAGVERLGICSPPGQAKQDAQLRAFLMENPSKLRVDLVEMEGPRAGLKTAMSVIADVSDCAPLLDRSRIPAPRLSTMDPNWSPVA